MKKQQCFFFGIFLFNQLSFVWWLFPALIFLPDISMIGYAAGNESGAILYNIVHHKAVALIVYVAGFYLYNETIMLMGIILFSHSTMDRFFGYGLKYFTGFSDTYLGKIGKEAKA
ncbi:MAG: DUF4260 domain-containing protein [Parafilimonas sp.]